MLRSLAIAIAAAALALAPASAGAEGMSEEQKLAQSLPVAEAAFVQTGCAGRITVTLNADLARLDRPPAVAQGLAWLAGVFGDGSRTCEIDVVVGLSPDRFCRVLVHEFGHVAGHRHVADVHDVMHAESLAYDGCPTFTPAAVPVPPPAVAPQPPPAEVRSPYQQIVHAARAELPAWLPWTVTCKAYRARVARRVGAWGVCRARSSGARRPRVFLMAVDRGEATAYRET